MLFERPAGQTKIMLGAFNAVSCGHSLDGLNRDAGLLYGPGQFTRGGFNVRTQFRACLAAHIGSTLATGA